jgi:hypothetical protein
MGITLNIGGAMLVNRIDVNLLNVPQKDPIHNQPVKFIDEKNNESEYDFEGDLIVINLRQVRNIEKRTKVHSSIVTAFLFFHEIGHKNDPYWQMVRGSNRLYKTLDKEILELSLSRYKKIEGFADNYAKDHKPSYIRKKEWEILYNESIEKTNQNCKTNRIELERSIKWKALPDSCIPVEVEFSDENIDEIRKKYNISIKENDIPEIKILKI